MDGPGAWMQAVNAAANWDKGGGWIPDPPDRRDYSYQTGLVRDLMDRTRAWHLAEQELPSRIDLRPWMSPVEYQGPLNSCTAQSVCGLVEYFERRTFGRFTQASRLFLYKATRNFIGSLTDSGAFLRSTMGTLRLIGVPPERYWPYLLPSVNIEPPAFCYALADDFSATVYYRLDPVGTTREEIINRLRIHLASGLPAAFGFVAYVSILDRRLGGDIPLPAFGEAFFQTHAIAAAGYDDDKRIRNPAPGSPETVGALLIRNSWGTGWGGRGYGWLPYDYIRLGQARDFWVLVSSKWIDTGQFDP